MSSRDRLDVAPQAEHRSAPSRQVPAKAASFAQDLLEGARRYRLWSALAWEDLRQRFSRSFVGLLWTTISFAFFVAVKVLIFRPLNEAGFAEFTLFLSIGFFAWLFVNAAIVEGCNGFMQAAAWLKSTRLPISVFAFQTVARNVVLAGYNFAVVIGLMALFGHAVPLAALVCVPVFAAYMLTALGIAYVLGAASARYRDVMHLVTTIMRVMFFLTPILWLPEQIGSLWRYLRFNPIAHYVIAFRDPLLYGTVPMLSLLVVAGVTALSLLGAALTFGAVRRRLVFWI